MDKSKSDNIHYYKTLILRVGFDENHIKNGLI